MGSFRLAGLAILSAFVVALMTLPLEAGEARASGNAVVRDGPGERFHRIGRLVDGVYYEVEECTRESRWCLVSYDGDVLGWARGSYLVGSPAKLAVTPQDFGFTRRPLASPFPFAN